MDNKSELEESLAAMKENLHKLYKESLRHPEMDLELIILDAIMVFIPKEISLQIPEGWIFVLSFDEDEVAAEGREEVPIQEYLKDAFVLTKEGTGDEGEFAYTAWIK